MPSSLIPLRPDELDTRTPVSTDWVIITPTGGPAYKCAVSSIGGGGGSAPTVNTVSGTSYTLALTDANNRIVCTNNSSVVSITIPLESSVAFPIGTGIDIVGYGTSTVIIGSAVGVTFTGTPGKSLRAQYSGCSLIKTASNTWVIVGDTSP